jgi:hypothetical protein
MRLGRKDSLVHDLVGEHKSNDGDEILRTPCRIEAIEEARMGAVAVAWGVARLLEFCEVVEGKDNDGGGELGHGDDAPKPLDKVIRGLKLALEVCGIEMVGGMRKPQPADHLGIGTGNIVEEILYTLGRAVRGCGEGVDGGVEGGGKMGKV